MPPEEPPPRPPKTWQSSPPSDHIPEPTKQRKCSSEEDPSTLPPPPPVPSRSRLQEHTNTSVPPQRPQYHRKRPVNPQTSNIKVADLPDGPPPPPPQVVRKSAELVFGTNNISGLSSDSYDTFIAGKEKALIMFYDSTDRSDPAIGGEFGLAAASSKNTRYAFGALDCSTDPDMCCRERVNSLPLLKLYSNGFEVSSLCALDNFTSQHMMMLVAMAPVLTQPRVKTH